MSTQVTPVVPSAPVPSTTHQTETVDDEPVHEFENENGELVPYNFKRLTFSEWKEEAVPAAKGSKGKPLVGYRTSAKDRTSSGRLQDVIWRSSKLFSFGPSPSLSNETGKLTGYSLPLCMYSRDGATPFQTALVEHLEGELLPVVKEHIIATRAGIKKPKLEMSDLKNMKIFHRKKDGDGNVIPDADPIWYVKLITKKMNKGGSTEESKEEEEPDLKILSRFYLADAVDENGNAIELDPSKLIERMGTYQVCIKFDSIYSGKDISLQFKVYDADVKLDAAFLPRRVKANPNAKLVVVSDNDPMSAMMLGAKKREEMKADPAAHAILPAAAGEGNEVTADDGNEVTVTDSTPAAITPPSAAAPVVVKKVVVKKVIKKPAA
jgi:hypothetical protein